ncbi:MAG: bestrophin family ion channel, partial [Thermomonas sp.]
PTNPNGWELAEIRLRPQYVDNDFDTGQIDFNWNISPGFRLKGGVLAKDYTFKTVELRRASELAVPLREGRLHPYLYAQFEARLHAMASVQAGCERISGTPLPFAYTLLLHRCAWLFCVLLPFGLAGALGWATPVVSMLLAYAFFGLDQLGEEMEEPFGTEANDLPLDAMVRTIEIDLLDALGHGPL